MTAQICVQISVVSGLISLKITCKLLPFEDGKSIRAPQGGTIPKYLDFFHISSNCCCTHLLANSQVLDLLDAPFQSYDGFCPCYFTY